MHLIQNECNLMRYLPLFVELPCFIGVIVMTDVTHKEEKHKGKLISRGWETSQS